MANLYRSLRGQRCDGGFPAALLPTGPSWYLYPDMRENRLCAARGYTAGWRRMGPIEEQSGSEVDVTRFAIRLTPLTNTPK